mmetsp:Transcript_10920/g.29189  ORF Transcript_10920/g.29189 Transcript_10920/m.29189 type:complete len:282 (+) Transcript_10920:417-1262(+)
MRGAPEALQLGGGGVLLLLAGGPGGGSGAHRSITGSNSPSPPLRDKVLRKGLVRRSRRSTIGSHSPSPQVGEGVLLHTDLKSSSLLQRPVAGRGSPPPAEVPGCAATMSEAAVETPEPPPPAEARVVARLGVRLPDEAAPGDVVEPPPRKAPHAKEPRLSSKPRLPNLGDGDHRIPASEPSDRLRGVSSCREATFSEEFSNFEHFSGSAGSDTSTDGVDASCDCALVSPSESPGTLGCATTALRRSRSAAKYFKLARKRAFSSRSCRPSSMLAGGHGDPEA